MFLDEKNYCELHSFRITKMQGITCYATYSSVSKDIGATPAVHKTNCLSYHEAGDWLTVQHAYSERSHSVKV